MQGMLCQISGWCSQIVSSITVVSVYMIESILSPCRSYILIIYRSKWARKYSEGLKFVFLFVISLYRFVIGILWHKTGSDCPELVGSAISLQSHWSDLLSARSWRSPHWLNRTLPRGWDQPHQRKQAPANLSCPEVMIPCRDCPSGQWTSAMATAWHTSPEIWDRDITLHHHIRPSSPWDRIWPIFRWVW